MRLYYFTTRTHGLLALKNRRLKISRINELNDPFEFMAWNTRDAGLRARLREWKNQRNEEYGIVCFSSKWRSPVLWSHYADKHAGIAIGFEVPDGDVYNRVRYRRTRLPVPRRELVGSDVDEVLLTKFSAWRYESEYRCLCRLHDSLAEGDLFFEQFSYALELAQVIVGERCQISRAELSIALGQEYSHVERFKVRSAFGSFSVVRNRDQKLWK